MSIPNVSGALRGWTKKRQVIIVLQTVVNHKVVEVTNPAIWIDINVQPLPQERIDKKPEGQRSWKWRSLWVKFGPLLKTDDKLIIDGITYRIMSVSNWSEGGYQAYEAIEDYQ